MTKRELLKENEKLKIELDRFKLFYMAVKDYVGLYEANNAIKAIKDYIKLDEILWGV